MRYWKRGKGRMMFIFVCVWGARFARRPGHISRIPCRCNYPVAMSGKGYALKLDLSRGFQVFRTRGWLFRIKRRAMATMRTGMTATT